MTEIDVCRDVTAGVTAVRLTGDADARTASRVIDAMDVARTMAPDAAVEVDLSGAGHLSPAFAVVLARSVHAWRRAGRRITVVVPPADAGTDEWMSPVGALLRPVAVGVGAAT